MSDEVAGLEAKAYYNTGTDATPTWVEIKRAKDVSVSLDKSMADVSRRESTWKMEIGALKEASIEIAYQFRKGDDTVFDALLDSFINGTAHQFAIMDQAIATSGAQGLKAFCECSGFPYEQPLEDSQIFNVTLKPTSIEESGSLVEPSWLETP